MRFRSLLLAGLAAPALNACAGPVAGSGPSASPGPRGSGSAAITAGDLRRDLFFLASDSMRGRRGATDDELRASMWLAAQAQAMGLQPAGDDGTFFQFFPVRRFRLSETSTVTLGGRTLRLWEDAVVMAPVDARVDAPVMSGDAPLAAGAASGRAVVARLRPPANPTPRWVSLWSWRQTSGAVNAQRTALTPASPSALVFVADSVGLLAFENLIKSAREGRYLLDTLGVNPRVNIPPVPVILVRPEVVAGLDLSTARLTADLRTESFIYPSVNVVARVPGTDPALRDEHVLFSGHQDHDGVNRPVNGDSIWNGADDNATVSVALLAIGRAFVREPGRRSALFVWHGSEERGLLGSYWYARTPTIPRGGIVAVLNADMIGRNSPDSAALLGVTAPHRNSQALVNMALAANPGFALDSTWDAATHPEGWYFRSDHLPYARVGIPAIFFTTLLHADYHTPEDEPERINIAKLERMTRWMYATGWSVANAAARPALDPQPAAPSR